eukprot:gene7491-11814_t
MSKELLLDSIYQEFDSMLNYFQIQKSFSVYLDGSPPILKIPKMYRSRRKNKNINQLQITPETDFLKDIKMMISENYSKKCRDRGVEFSISGSCESGEGEIKILNKMKNERIDSDTLIIGCDSDFIPICLSVDKKVDFLFRNFTRPSELFNFEELNNHLKLMFNTDDLSNIKLDLTLLCLLQGNDYLTKLYQFDLKIALENYIKFDEISINHHIITIEKDGKYNLNIPFLLKLMNFNGESLKMHCQMFYDREAVINYLRLLLWNLDMYLHGECMDYQFMPELAENILPQLLFNEYKNNENFMEEIQPPRNKLNNLNPLTISRAVMPESGIEFLPFRLRNMEFDQENITLDGIMKLEESVLKSKLK